MLVVEQLVDIGDLLSFGTMCIATVGADMTGIIGQQNLHRGAYKIIGVGGNTLEHIFATATSPHLWSKVPVCSARSPNLAASQFQAPFLTQHKL